MATAAVRSFPPGALLGGGALILIAIGSSLLAHTTGIGRTGVMVAAPVTSIDLRFADRSDGAVVVTGAEDGHAVAVLPPGTNGFARGVLRGLARERHRREVGESPAFRLTRWADNRLSLLDTATGASVDLEAFGETNEAVFARLLLPQGATP